MIAWNADTGKRIWRFNTAPIESSPLLVKNTLYFGAWDNKVYALNATNGRKRWTFQADDQMNTSAAYWNNTIYMASYAGSVYAINARTGKMRWKAQSRRARRAEFFYASPAVAYGRVYIGNSDGTMYVYGAKTGKLRWARPLGSLSIPAPPSGSGACAWAPTTASSSPRRRHRRREVAEVDALRRALVADRDGRPRVRVGPQQLRPGRPAGRQARTRRHVRARRPERQDGVACAPASSPTPWWPTPIGSTWSGARTCSRSTRAASAAVASARPSEFPARPRPSAPRSPRPSSATPGNSC